MSIGILEFPNPGLLRLWWPVLYACRISSLHGVSLLVFLTFWDSIRFGTFYISYTFPFICPLFPCLLTFFAPFSIMIFHQPLTTCQFLLNLFYPVRYGNTWGPKIPVLKTGTSHLEYILSSFRHASVPILLHWAESGHTYSAGVGMIFCLFIHSTVQSISLSIYHYPFAFQPPPKKRY